MKKKMNNKGFSLVELIIVIAIMAVLVGVLAPAYMRYVEGSRQSRDVSALDSAMTVVETALIDYAARQNDDSVKVTITVGEYTPAAVGGVTPAAYDSIKVTGGDTGTDSLQADMNKMIGDYKLASAWDSATDQTITATCANGSVTFTENAPASGTGFVAKMKAYSAALTGRF